MKARTINLHRVSRLALERARAEVPEAAHRRLPLTRAECVSGPRPCPYVSCRWHLFLDDLGLGSVKLNFPDLIEPDGGLRLEELAETCALDVAGRGERALEYVGDLVNITQERVNQLEDKLLGKLGTGARAALLRQFH